jgi:CRISPR-associated protein Cmr6
MALPSYKDNHAPNNRPSHANAGLWFERFFDQFDHTWQVRDQKIDWLKNNFNRSSGESQALENHAIRQQQLCQNLEGISKVFKTQWHFVTGMGNPHPIENGLSWHPTLGVPYLSGAAVKGMVRNWLEIWEQETTDESQKAKLLNWFGSTSKNPLDRGYEVLTGNLIFFDAFPIESVLMNVDIMTPHMGKWYEKGNEIKNIAKDADKIPADWHDPTPISYLVIKKARFLFSIAPRKTTCDINLPEVMEVLEKALDYVGAGAKTATGYGQMKRDEAGSNSLKDRAETQHHQAALERLSNELQLVAELEQHFKQDQKLGNKAAGNPTYQKMLALIKQAKEEDWRQQDKNTLAELGKAIVTYIGWGKTKIKKKRKAIFNELRGEQ